METGDAILLLGAGALVVYAFSRNQQPVVYLSRPFGRHSFARAEVVCPPTVLSMCPGEIPTCYEDGTISCGHNQIGHSIPDLMGKMQSFCVQNPAVCKAAP